MMGAREGRRRFTGHFSIWLAVPHLASGAGKLAGAGKPFLAGAEGLAFMLFVLIVLSREASQVLDGKHDVVKAAYDATGKILGFGLGLMTWGGWW